MALIGLNNLGVALGAPLFANLSLTISAGDRLGLVAANGRGKSTLLRCLAGTIEATTGDVTRARGVRVGHVEQDAPARFNDHSFIDVVRGALPADQLDAESWRVDVALDALNVPESMRARKLAHLSGGWRRLAMLARVAVEPAGGTEPHVEPGRRGVGSQVIDRLHGAKFKG